MTTLVVRDSGTENTPLEIDGEGYDSAWILGDYVHVDGLVVPDGVGRGYGAGLSLEGSYCKMTNFQIGERWRGVDIRNGASYNKLENIHIARSWDGIYISGPTCEYNVIENASCYEIGLNDETKDGHSFAVMNCNNNTFKNIVSIRNMRETADIIAFNSKNTVFSRATSLGAKSQYHLSATIRSDGTVFDRCITDGIIDIGGTPNIRVIDCIGEVLSRTAGPNSDTSGLIVLP